MTSGTSATSRRIARIALVLGCAVACHDGPAAAPAPLDHETLVVGTYNFTFRPDSLTDVAHDWFTPHPYFDYYEKSRTHLGLVTDAPIPRPIQPHRWGKVIETAAGRRLAPLLRATPPCTLYIEKTRREEIFDRDNIQSSFRIVSEVQPLSNELRRRRNRVPITFAKSFASGSVLSGTRSLWT